MFADALKIDYIISNIISWIIAVIFAYFINSRFVFNSNAVDKKREVIEFILYRLLFIDKKSNLLYNINVLIS